MGIDPESSCAKALRRKALFGVSDAEAGLEVRLKRLKSRSSSTEAVDNLIVAGFGNLPLRFFLQDLSDKQDMCLCRPFEESITVAKAALLVEEEFHRAVKNRDFRAFTPRGIAVGSLTDLLQPLAHIGLSLFRNQVPYVINEVEYAAMLDPQPKLADDDRLSQRFFRGRLNADASAAAHLGVGVHKQDAKLIGSPRSLNGRCLAYRGSDFQISCLYRFATMYSPFYFAACESLALRAGADDQTFERLYVASRYVEKSLTEHSLICDYCMALEGDPWYVAGFLRSLITIPLSTLYQAGALENPFGSSCPAAESELDRRLNGIVPRAKAG